MKIFCILSARFHDNGQNNSVPTIRQHLVSKASTEKRWTAACLRASHDTNHSPSNSDVQLTTNFCSTYPYVLAETIHTLANMSGACGVCTNTLLCIGSNSTWLDSTRLDSTRSTLSSQLSQSSKSRRACRARRAVLFQHGGRRTILYKFSRFYALAYTILFVSSNKIN